MGEENPVKLLSGHAGSLQALQRPSARIEQHVFPAGLHVDAGRTMLARREGGSRT